MRISAMPIRTTMLLAASAFALAGCAGSPGMVAPPARLGATAGPLLPLDAGVVSPTPLPDQWWQLYRDPVLDRLVADALAANTDIRQATACRKPA